MRNLMLVGIGGFVGSVSRYYLSSLVLHLTAASRMPWATLVVNTIGCLVIGALAGGAELRHILTPTTRLFLLTGLLGGFTTFSAFGFETYFLGREHLWFEAFLNVALHLAIALPAVWLGHRLVMAVLAG
jgi:CrcB protein